MPQVEAPLPGPDIIPLVDGRVDLTACRIERGSERSELSPLEVDLLRYLAEKRAAPVSREELLVEVWGYRPGVVSRAVDKTVARLRAKIERDPAQPEHLLLVRGVGYRLEAETRAAEEAPDGDGFVGRGADLDRLDAFFERGCRLVTVTGAGGSERRGSRAASALAAAARSRVACGSASWRRREPPRESGRS